MRIRSATSAAILSALIGFGGLPTAAPAEDIAAGQPRTGGEAIAEAALPAVAVVDGFAAALKRQDFETIRDALDPDAIVLEAGGAEHGRDEYMGHHAIADALFMARAEVAVLRRTARVESGLAWVASETEIVDPAQNKTRLGTETMILRDTPAGWKIVHIHWSSRPKP